MKNNKITIDLTSYEAVSNLHKLPHNGDKQAEDSLIACLINHSQHIESYHPALSEKMFFNPINKLMFEAFVELESEQREINEISLMEKTKINKEFIVDFRLNKILIASFDELCLRVIDSYYTDEIRNITSNSNFDITIDRSKLDEIYNLIAQAKKDSIKTNVRTLLDMIDELEDQTFIKTNQSEIDYKIGGFPQSGFIVIAGRSGMGKSSFMSTLCLANSLTTKACYMTIEMKNTQIGNKMVKMNVKKNIQNVQIIEYDYVYIDRILEDITKLAQSGTKFFYVDYVQMIRANLTVTNERASISCANF